MESMVVWHICVAMFKLWRATWSCWSLCKPYFCGRAWCKRKLIVELRTQGSMFGTTFFFCSLCMEYPYGSQCFACDWLRVNRKTLEEGIQILIWPMQRSWLCVWDWVNQIPKMSPQNLVLLLMVMRIATWSLVKGNISLVSAILILSLTCIHNLSCPIRFFVTPSDSVAIIAANAVEAIPYFKTGLKGVARYFIMLLNLQSISF